MQPNRSKQVTFRPATSTRSALLFIAICLIAGQAAASGLFIAASDAPAESLAGADFFCGGHDDAAVIREALGSTGPEGGLVILSEGTFWCDNTTIELPAGTTLQGAGIGLTRIVFAGGGIDTGGSAIRDCSVAGGNVVLGAPGAEASQVSVVSPGTGRWGFEAAAVPGERRISLSGCAVIESEGGGFAIQGPVNLTGCLASTCQEAGFRVTGAGAMLDDCTDRGSGTGYLITNAAGVTLTGCRSDTAAGTALAAVNATGLQVDGFVATDPAGNGEACIVIGSRDLPVSDSSFRIDATGGESRRVVALWSVSDVTLSGSIVTDRTLPLFIGGRDTRDVTIRNVTIACTAVPPAVALFIDNSVVASDTILIADSVIGNGGSGELLSYGIKNAGVKKTYVRNVTITDARPLMEDCIDETPVPLPVVPVALIGIFLLATILLQRRYR